MLTSTTVSPAESRSTGQPQLKPFDVDVQLACTAPLPSVTSGHECSPFPDTDSGWTRHANVVIAARITVRSASEKKSK